MARVKQTGRRYPPSNRQSLAGRIQLDQAYYRPEPYMPEYYAAHDLDHVRSIRREDLVAVERLPPLLKPTAVEEEQNSNDEIFVIGKPQDGGDGDVSGERIVLVCYAPSRPFHLTNRFVRYLTSTDLITTAQP
jgi:hypothetical protein